MAPFEKKDEVKAKGAKWDKIAKLWYVNDKDLFKELIDTYELTYLNAPYEANDILKANGARWDKENKSWYTYKTNEPLKQFMI